MTDDTSKREHGDVDTLVTVSCEECGYIGSRLRPAGDTLVFTHFHHEWTDRRPPVQ